MALKTEITTEVIDTFMEGHDPMKGIVNLEYSFRDDKIKVYYRNEKDEKCVHWDSFYPFLWAKRSVCVRMCNGDRQELLRLMRSYGIAVKALDVTDKNGNIQEDAANGYCFMFYATKPMSQQKFNMFFKQTGCPVRTKDGNDSGMSSNIKKEYLMLSAQEMYLTYTGKRFFKGYYDYNDLLRLIFDLETEGLDPTRHRIDQVGIRINRPTSMYPDGFDRVFAVTGNTKAEKDKSELECIDTMMRVIYTFKPDIITGHNVENFDWRFIIERCNQLGTSIAEVSSKYFNGKSIEKDFFETTLKLGGEVEKFYATNVPGIITTDSLHAVRRAMATDSNMLRADLKYATKYAKMVKKNRVYTPGDKISEIWNDTVHQYAFNDNDGDWYIYDPQAESTNGDFKKGKEDDKPFVIYTRNYLAEGYTLTTGRYIVERYLLDDIWEGDKVEWKFNATNFLICKILPLPFKKCCTMGTAGQWRALLLAWCFENNLAVPSFSESKTFTGGLSRLLSTGYVKNVAKLDYNSLYPSIILTWAIQDPKDTSGVMLKLLNYVLTQREKYKGLKKAAGKVVEELEEKVLAKTATQEEIEKYNKAAEDFAFNDKKQNQMKVLGNSMFGSFGNPSLFNFGSLTCAERTTCTGRMALRLMISHFSNLGYRPIVGDSFTPDTPLFIKYNDSDLIDIKPIEELVNESEINVDAFGREYDYSEKNYKVLCRSGWVTPSYIYRHKTDKDIYEVTEGNMQIEVTEDHSLFDADKKKLNPKNITSETKLEYYTNEIKGDVVTECNDAEKLGEKVASEGGRVPVEILNANKENMKLFYDAFMKKWKLGMTYSKTCIAGLQYLKKNIN